MEGVNQKCYRKGKMGLIAYQEPFFYLREMKWHFRISCRFSVLANFFSVIAQILFVIAQQSLKKICDCCSWKPTSQKLIVG